MLVLPLFDWHAKFSFNFSSVYGVHGAEWYYTSVWHCVVNDTSLNSLQVEVVRVHEVHSRKQNSFPLQVASDLTETAPPGAKELHLLREEIDPLGIRRLETLGGGARKRLLREILENETNEPRSA